MAQLHRGSLMQHREGPGCALGSPRKNSCLLFPRDRLSLLQMLLPFYVVVGHVVDPNREPKQRTEKPCSGTHVSKLSKRQNGPIPTEKGGLQGRQIRVLDDARSPVPAGDPVRVVRCYHARFCNDNISNKTRHTKRQTHETNHVRSPSQLGQFVLFLRCVP